MTKKNRNTKQPNQIKDIINNIMKFSFFIIAFSYFLVFFLYFSQFLGVDNSVLLQQVKDFLLIYLFIILSISMFSHYSEQN